MARKSSTVVSQEAVLSFYVEMLSDVSDGEMDCDVSQAARNRRDRLRSAGEAYLRELSWSEAFLADYEDAENV